MGRLVTFGCSHTYGLGLDDLQQAWPQVLANKLNLECVNKGIPGLSIKGISQEIDSFEFQKDDTVVILWTAQGRWSFKTSENELVRIFPNYTPDHEIAQLWYKHFFNWEDDFFLSRVLIKHIDSFLDSKGIRTIHAFAGYMNIKKGEGLTPLEYRELLRLKGDVYPKRFYDGYINFGFAKDGSHLNEAAHTSFAVDLHRLFYDSCLI